MKQENKIESYIVQNNIEMPRVVDDYYNYISTIIKNTCTLSREDEEEIISDVFLIIWKNKEKLDKKAQFSPYIAGITKKIIYRKYKELQRNIQFIECEGEIIDRFDIESILEHKEMNDLITNNIKQIGQVNYEIFTKFYYEGKKVKIIAKEMNLSVSNVKTKLHRTREKVKEVLKKGGFTK